MTDQAVRVERSGPVTTVFLHRPARRNAVDGPTAAELAAAFRAFDADPDAAVAVLHGAGGVFCSGADLTAFGTDRANRVAADGDAPMGVSRLRLSKPVIAAVAGYAVAGGLELALWCDLRVADETAVFGVFCRRWGVPLIDGGTVRLPRLIGTSRAMDMILTGRAVDAAEALAMGLANRVVPAGQALDAAQRLAAELAALPQACLRTDRASVLDAEGLDSGAALASEFAHGRTALASSEAGAGAARFASGAGRHGELPGYLWQERWVIRHCCHDPAPGRLGVMRTVLVVLFDGVQSLDVTGPLEALAGARTETGEPGYEVRTASLDGAAVRTSSGLRLTPDGALRELPGRQRLDLLLLPGGHGARHADPDLIAWVRDHAGQAGRLASVCTGAFVLAEAGLLAGKRVTTHWAYCDKLAAKYPGLTVDPDPIFIRDGNVITSAGVTSGIDLALALIEEDLGRAMALTVARHLVVFLRRPASQSQFSAQLQAQTATSKPIRDVQQWITEHPAGDLTVEALAVRASLSPRQFARAFAAEVGLTPGRYVDNVRIEAARRCLEDSADGIEQAARACGYGTPEAMRRAFIKTLGVSPAEYRRRFSAKEAHADSHPAL